MQRSTKYYLYITIAAALLFLPFLGASHLFDWDEINFAEAAREMVVTGNYSQVQIDFQPFWEKPPLFFWMQAISMHVFGVNEYAARFPNALCGILTLLVLFSIGNKLRDEKFGLLWVLAYACSILPQVYFKSGIIDPWFNLFIFLGFYQCIVYLDTQFRVRHIIYSALFFGLAIMTKGPVAIFLFGIVAFVYLIFRRFRMFMPWKHVPVFIFFCVLVFLPWVSIEYMRNGSWFLQKFITYQFRLAGTEDAGHGGFFGYHFVVNFLLCFPASVFAIRGLRGRKKQDEKTRDDLFATWMRILLWAVLIVFSIIQTKIAHYSSLVYFPLTYLAATTLYRKEGVWTGWESIGLIITGLFFTAVIICVPMFFMHPDMISSFVHDAFTAEALHAQGGWGGWEPYISILLVAGLILAFFERKKNIQRATWIFINCRYCYQRNGNFFTPHIERYSQGAMIDFLIDKSTEDCYTDVQGQKSYAPGFYGKHTPGIHDAPAFRSWLHAEHPEAEDDPQLLRKQFSVWLQYGDIDKTAYIITNVRKKEHYMDSPQMEYIGNKNGFYFFKREPAP
ncbi:MAG: glycosyltransferase family 39 protein [Chitinophagales bacterium]